MNIVWVELSPAEIFQLVRYRHIESTEFNSVPILWKRMEEINGMYTHVYTDRVNIIIYWAKTSNIQSLQHWLEADDQIDINPLSFEWLNNIDIHNLIQKGILLENQVYYINDFESTYDSFDTFVYTLDTEERRYVFQSEQLEEVLEKFY
jgi:hypothetical protein